MKTLLLALTCLASAWAGSVTLTMDEVPFQPINGLSVTKGGITFTFADTSGADYDAEDGGQETFVQDPAIEGPTVGETITISFSQPMFQLAFGMADSTQGTGFEMASVNFYNGATLLGNQSLDASVTDAFSQGEFVYGGTFGYVTSIQIAPDSGPAAAFAIDNLFVTTLTPEPSALFSSFAGLLALTGIAIWKRRSRAASANAR